jgi:uncharacterized protein (TIGR03437 family)
LKTTPQSLRYLAISFLFVSAAVLGQAQQNTLSTSQSSNNNVVYGTIGLAPVNYQLTVTSNPNTNVPITITPNASWISVAAPAPGSTPATVQLAFNPNDKNITAPGVYQGSVTISSPSASSVTAAFVFTVNNTTPLAASPQALQFTYITGGSLPAAQSLNISASSTILYSVSVSAPWLVLGAGTNSGQTPGVITVGVDPSSLTAQCCYVGSVNITPTNGLPGIVVPVILNYQPSPQLIIAPTSLTFNYQIGGNSNVVQKNLNLSTPPGGPIVTFSATPGTTSGGQWLVVNTPSGLTPNVVNIQVNPAGLPAGQYQGTVTVSGVGVSNPSTPIPVTLNVSAQPLLDLSAATLTFNYQTGGALPADQFIMPNGTTASMNYTIAVNTNNTGNWLNVTASGVTPAPVDVNVNPVGLPSGTYNGTITFNAINGGNNPQVVNVTLNVSTVPTVTPTPGSLTFNYEIGFNVPGAQTVSVSSSGGSLAFSVTANQTNTSNNVTWLLVGTPSSTTTPGTFTVAVSPAGMAAGQYSGTITVSSPGGANPVTVPVTLNVANIGNPLANVSPPSLTFNVQVGGTANPQVVTVSSTGEPINYTATAAVTTPQGSSWLTVGPPAGPASAATPTTFFVGVTPLTLGVGSYKGTITVDPKNGNPVVTIPVTINVTLGNLSLDSTTLSFTQNASGPAPQPKIVNVTSSGTPLQFTAFTAGASWLTVTPPSGTTPAQLSVAVNGANLQPGNYTGQISVVSAGAGNSPQTVTVNLTVAAAQALALNNTSLNFASTFGSPAPAAQTVALTASNGSLSFTAAAAVTGPQGVNWLSVTPTSGTASSTATNLSVSVNPQGLNPGTYTGSISVAAPNASNSPQTINVTYVVNAIPRPAPTTVINGASLQPGAVAPGEIITIMGTNLGPATGVSTTPSSGLLPTSFQNVQVSFDNLPAPLLYISATQINAVVPYSIAGRATTQLVVTYQNTVSASIVLNVAASAPGIVDVANTTQGAILNQDGTLNTPNNAAAKGSSIVFFATGEGQTTPPGVDGMIIPAVLSALKHPVLPVSVTIGGQPADIQYAGSLPGFVSGAMQVNVVVPAGAPSGPAVPVVLTVGGNSSQGIATVALQ